MYSVKNRSVREKVVEFQTRLKRLISRQVLDPGTRAFIEHNRRVFAPFFIKKPQGEILVELYTITQTVISFSYFANVLAKKHQASIKSFSASMKNGAIYSLAFRKFIKTYESFNSICHFNIHWVTAKSKQRKILVQGILEKVRTPAEFMELQILGYSVGCDVYETYLRECEMPTLDLHDPRLAELLEYAVNAVQFWSGYLDSHNVKAIILSHGCYRYGILSSIALKRNIPVYLPNIRGVMKIVESGKPGAHDFRNYPNLFRSLSSDEQKAGVALARTKLERRLGGEVGVNMPYSTKSAYASSLDSGRILKENDRLKVLIATHCFFDNPHAYGGNLFVDFYEWISLLGELSEKTSYDWYIKTHPDVAPGNHAVLDHLLKKYPKITLVPPRTPFPQLVREGLSVVLTVYGTVGHELPLLGVKVVNGGYNPHFAYVFNFHPKTLQEYRDHILNLDRLEIKVDPNQIYEFFYIHHYVSIVDDFITDSYYKLLREVGAAEQASPAVYSYFLKNFTETRHRSALDKMNWFIESGKTEFFDHEYRSQELTSSKVVLA